MSYTIHIENLCWIIKKKPYLRKWSKQWVRDKQSQYHFKHYVCQLCYGIFLDKEKDLNTPKSI